MWRRRSKIFSVPEIDPIKRSISQVCKFMSGALLILAIVSVSDVAAAAKSNSDRDSAKKPTAKVQDTNSAFELFDSGRYLAALDRAKELAAAGQPEAHTLIGKIYAEGLGVGRNFTEAASWYLKGFRTWRSARPVCARCIAGRGAGGQEESHPGRRLL